MPDARDAVTPAMICEDACALVNYAVARGTTTDAAGERTKWKLCDRLGQEHPPVVGLPWTKEKT